MGKIEDDSCQFKYSTVEGKPAVGIKGVNVGYVIFAHNTSMHAGRICGWAGYKKAVINSDSLLATIFGQGSIIMIIALVIVLAAAAVVIIIVYKKRKKNSKDSQSE